MTMQSQLAFFLIATLLAPHYCRALSTPKGATKTTIAVCTGPDCRVDGSSDCIRKLQQAVSSSAELKSFIRVTGRACVGPCGDGPCVMVTDSNSQKVIEPQPSKIQICLVEPDLFASNPKGWYQVRTGQQLDEVMDIACRDVGADFTRSEESTEEVFVSSTRAWFDRPRNERKVLQRLMQSLVLLGLYRYDGELGSLQYCITFGLFAISDFIMKENTWTLLSSKLRKRF